MLVTGNRVEKLHIVNTVGSGTGEQMVQTIVTAFMDRNIPFDFIVACCFDTKSSNASVHAIVERFIRRSLLHTTCHMVRVTISAQMKKRTHKFFIKSGYQPVPGSIL